MTDTVAAFWVYLQAGPLLWLTLTLVAYTLAFALYRRAGGNPLLNPVAVAVALILGVLAATRTGHATYFTARARVHALPARAGHGGGAT